MGALAAFMSALLAVLMVFGAGFTAVMLAVTGNRMFTEFAGTFRTIADTFRVNHGSDSSCVVASAQMHTVSVGATAGCDLLWRGSLLPLECVALTDFWGRCAARREQARSPQELFRRTRALATKSCSVRYGTARPDCPDADRGRPGCGRFARRVGFRPRRCPPPRQSDARCG